MIVRIYRLRWSIVRENSHGVEWKSNLRQTTRGPARGRCHAIPTKTSISPRKQKTNTEKRVRQELGVRGLFVLLSMRITTMLVVSILSDSFPDCLPRGGRILPRES